MYSNFLSLRFPEKGACFDILRLGLMSRGWSRIKLSYTPIDCMESSAEKEEDG